MIRRAIYGIVGIVRSILTLPLRVLGGGRRRTHTTRTTTARTHY